ncbi:MAG: hypothetical protein GEV06_27600 [Luteitalea sp.]|nr:hypothetical protein [Luteitalea sp.]
MRYILYRYVPAGCFERGAWRKTARAFHLEVVVGDETCRTQSEPQLIARTAELGATVEVRVAGGSSVPEARPNAAASVDTDTLDMTTLHSIPLYPRVYEVYGHEDDGQTAEARVRDFVEQTRVRAKRLVASTQALGRLSHRWSQETLARLGATSTSTWLTLLGAQGRAVAQEAVMLIAHLRPVLNELSTVPLPNLDTQGILTYPRDFADAPDGLELQRFLTENALTLGNVRDVVEHIQIHASGTDRVLRAVLTPARSPDDDLQDHVAEIVQELRTVAWLARLLQLPAFYPRDADVGGSQHHDAS